MDLINDGILWRHIMAAIEQNGSRQLLFGRTRVEIWQDGSQILVSDEAACDFLADFLDMLGFEAHTGYYDPAEDKADDCEDQYTGYWYIDLD